MKFSKKDEDRCSSVFDSQYRCDRELGHYGKHYSRVENVGSTSWTDAGLARVLKERREKENTQ